MSDSYTAFSLKKNNIRRILILEQYIMVPLKFIVVVFSFYFLTSLDRSKETDYYFTQLRLYVIANLVFFMAIAGIRTSRFRLNVIKIAAFFLSMIDNLYLSFLIYFTGGLDSELYLIYPGLFVRNAINFPQIKYQQTINLTLLFFYIGAIYQNQENFKFITNEVFILRMMMLILTSFCCWGVYFLIQRNSTRMQENQEKTIRTEKLHLAAKLAAQIAHELKNPLGIINNAVYLIKKNAGGDLSKIVRNAEIIQQEVIRSDKIISELLDYSSLVEGKIVRVDLNKFIVEFIENNFNSLKSENRITLYLKKNIPDLLIDKNQLEHILNNLLLNADESSDGKYDTKVGIKTFFDENEFIELEVTDNGNGIPANNLDKIFDPFYTTKHNHVGLGLSVVKNITETYGGNIKVGNISPNGLSVKVFFPVTTFIDKETRGYANAK